MKLVAVFAHKDFTIVEGGSGSGFFVRDTGKQVTEGGHGAQSVGEAEVAD